MSEKKFRTGYLAFPNSSGAVGEALISDGAGNLEWGAAGGGAGADGEDGATWTSSDADPSGGSDGDFHFNSLTNEIHKKVGDDWILIADITGATGATGATGDAGADGSGWTGISYDAATGQVTFTSDDGLGLVTGDLRGADGEDGDDGVDGDSAYQIAFEADSSIGTEADWLASLVGPTGPAGAAGAAGASSEGDEYAVNVSDGSGGLQESEWKFTSGHHLIPNSNAAYDLGNAEYKVRHLFLSDNSIRIGTSVEGDQNQVRIGMAENSLLIGYSSTHDGDAETSIRLPNNLHPGADQVLKTSAVDGVMEWAPMSSGTSLPDGSSSGDLLIWDGATWDAGTISTVWQEHTDEDGNTHIYYDSDASADGNIGIGTIEPESRLHMVGNGANTAQFLMEQFTDSSESNPDNGPDIRMFSARGTKLSPEAREPGDFIGAFNIRYLGIDGDDPSKTEWKTAGFFGWIAADDIVNGGSKFNLKTNVAGSHQRRLGVDDLGAVYFGPETYTFPTSVGTDGQVLKIDTSGVKPVLSWSDAGTIIPDGDSDGQSLIWNDTTSAWEAGLVSSIWQASGDDIYHNSDPSVDGNIGIGTSSPETRIHMVGDDPNSAQLLMDQHCNSTDGPDIRFRSARGSSSARLVRSSGDTLAAFNVHSWDGVEPAGSWVASGAMRWFAGLDPSAGESWFELKTNVGGSNDARLTILKSGAIEFSNGDGAGEDVNSYEFPTTRGAENQVLSTNASGILSWVDPDSGPAGADGKTILSGSGAPDDGSDGENGDFYIDTAANELYGPKVAGVWGSPTSLVGPEGPAGADGLSVYNTTFAPGGEAETPFWPELDGCHVGIRSSLGPRTVRLRHPRDVALGKTYVIGDIDGGCSEANKISVTVAAQGATEGDEGVVTNLFEGASGIDITSGWGNVKVMCVTRGGEGDIATADRMWVVISAWGTS